MIHQVSVTRLKINCKDSLNLLKYSEVSDIQVSSTTLRVTYVLLIEKSDIILVKQIEI